MERGTDYLPLEEVKDHFDVQTGNYLLYQSSANVVGVARVSGVDTSKNFFTASNPNKMLVTPIGRCTRKGVVVRGDKSRAEELALSEGVREYLLGRK
ncbi:MAG: hypothetical protein WC796_00115 [Candidatus Pacearchaeota archaeon]|jgi:hypothetical protein